MDHYSGAKQFKIPDFPLAVIFRPEAANVGVHTHDFIEIVLIEQGCAIHHIGWKQSQMQSYGLIQGDVFSIMPREIHRYERLGDMKIYNIALQKELLRPVLTEFSAMESWKALFPPCRGEQRSKIHLTEPERKEAKSCLTEIIRELAIRQSGFELNAKLALWKFLMIVLRAKPNRWHSSKFDNSGISKTIIMMENTPQSQFTLRDLARSAAMSVSSYTRKFREATGVSAIAYLQNLRLECARRMLETTTLTVEEISIQCGFCDSNYMIKQFRLHQGVTPARYRKNAAVS